MRVFVTGYPRSGTTWMMMCLKRGGMRTVACGKRFETAENVVGKRVCDGKAVKAFVPWFKHIKLRDDDVIIWMCRPPGEIVQSCKRCKIQPYKWDFNQGNYFLNMKQRVHTWRTEGATVFICYVPEVNLDRRAFFRKLAAGGVPIDVEKAATTPNIDRISQPEREALQFELKMIHEEQEKIANG